MGPTTLFKAIQRLRHFLPEWFPLLPLELGYTNIVPVDYVAAALDHIAHEHLPWSCWDFGLVRWKAWLVQGRCSWAMWSSAAAT